MSGGGGGGGEEERREREGWARRVEGSAAPTSPAQTTVDDGDTQGLIRVYKPQRLAPKDFVSTPKKRRRWLCKQLGLVARCKQQRNFLNLTEDEMQDIKSHNEILAVKKEAHFRNMFSAYITGIVGDEGIMKEMNELVAKHDHMLANKRLHLHQQWHEQVYEKISEQVEDKLKLLSANWIKDKNRYFHYQYMNASNQRVLFLDVVDNTFYNPFESLKYVVKYNTNSCDPLKHDLDKVKCEALANGEDISKGSKMKTRLDASMWHYAKLRSSVWGHLNADEEDPSQLVVKDLEKWHSHDVLYNTKCSESEPCKEEFLRGKHIVPNQGKQWSFRERHEGKGKVYGLPCMTQPKLQLYYV